MLRILRQLYGDMPVAAFRSVELLALRNWTMQRRDWCRKHLNDQIWRVKAVFSWAVMTGLAPASVADGLAYVRSIRKGKSPLRDNPSVRPVAPSVLAKVKPHLSRHLAAVLELQFRTGARSSELLGLRIGQVIRKRRRDGTRRWWAVLDHHKTAHHGKSRRLYFLRRARAVLRPFLVGRPVGAFIFDPRDAERERRDQLHASRRTPASCGNSPGTNRTAAPAVAPGERYTVAAYRRAIARACDAAFPPPEHLARRTVASTSKTGPRTRLETDAEWRARLGPKGLRELLDWQRAHRFHPHQVRHTAATIINRRGGLDAARAILGHSSMRTAAIYAEADVERALAAIEGFG